MALFILLVQCVCMLGASLAVGGLPLFFKSAATGVRLQVVSVLGMGILVGAALTIIIPEGVSTLYESLPAHDEHTESTVSAMGLSLLAGFALMLLIESLGPSPSDAPAAPTPPSPTGSEHSSLGDAARPHPPHLDSRSLIVPKRLHVHDGCDQEQGRGGHSVQHQLAHGLSATLGMVIHGAADGIALGASSRSGNSGLGLVIFMAVLVHKGPTALGLTTTLLSLGLPPPAIRHRLLVFSLAAPIGAIVTYLVVGLFGQNSSSKTGGVDGLGWWTGIALLFSGGSFLYVATVIQPLASPGGHGHASQEHSHQTPPPCPDPNALGKYHRTGLLVLGMLLPIALSWIVGETD